ncbi:MAG: response regulator [Thermodesulfobacteriota bacterium]
METTSVLIVDDEQEFASTLAERLELRGLAATSVASGEEALDRLRGHLEVPDVVILDLKMPGIDGLEALVAIKSLEPQVEVILLTGHGSSEAGIAGMQRGLFDYLMKPVDIAELVDKIGEAAARRRRSLAAEADAPAAPR